MRTGKVFLVIVAVLTLAGAAGAQTEPVPFECTGEAYTVRDKPADLYVIDQTQIPFAFVSIRENLTGPFAADGGQVEIQVNNLGYNSADGLLYAIAMPMNGNFNYGIIQIDSRGLVFPFPLNSGALPTARLLAGDVAPEGNIFYLNTYPSGTLYTVDLLSRDVSSVGTSQRVYVADWAVNPGDGMLYGAAAENLPAGSTDAIVYQLDPLSGTISEVGSVPGLPRFSSGEASPNRYYGGSWFKPDGTLVLYRNIDEIYEVDLSGPTFLASFIGGAGPSELNDAAACAIEPDPPCERDLIAGGGNEASAIDVGSIQTNNHGDNSWTVGYHTTGGWELTELHLHVTCDNCDEGKGFPLNKKGNPQIGHFFYTAYPEPGTQSFVFPDDADDFEEVIPVCGNFKEGFFEGECECPIMAAHAVVTHPCADVASLYLYGVENGTGDLYGIDMTTGTATLIEALGGAYGTGSYPNGAAWDSANSRFYFTASNGDLYFWEDGAGVTHAGAITGGQIADGTFYDGKFYYIANNTDDVQEVVIDSDGLVVSQAVICADIAGGAPLGFGDIVINPEGTTLYVSAGITTTSPSTPAYYAVDLASCDTNTTVPETWVQLAYGTGGVLYGQDTNSGDFYVVDPMTGAFIGDPFTILKDDGAVFKSNDLTSDAVCVPQTETAWGDGEEFVDSKSWAMYFDACECLEPEPIVD